MQHVLFSCWKRGFPLGILVGIKHGFLTHIIFFTFSRYSYPDIIISRYLDDYNSICTLNRFPQGVCVTLAALMQYFFMAALCWMLVEGIYLYLVVVKVYNVSHKISVYHGISWGRYKQGYM